MKGGGGGGGGGEEKRKEEARRGRREGADGIVFFAAKWQRAHANRVETSAATSQEYKRTTDSKAAGPSNRQSLGLGDPDFLISYLFQPLFPLPPVLPHPSRAISFPSSFFLRTFAGRVQHLSLRIFFAFAIFTYGFHRCRAVFSHPSTYIAAFLKSYRWIHRISKMFPLWCRVYRNMCTYTRVSSRDEDSCGRRSWRDDLFKSVRCQWNVTKSKRTSCYKFVLRKPLTLIHGTEKAE